MVAPLGTARCKVLFAGHPVVATPWHLDRRCDVVASPVVAATAPSAARREPTSEEPAELSSRPGPRLFLRRAVDRRGRVQNAEQARVPMQLGRASARLRRVPHGTGRARLRSAAVRAPRAPSTASARSSSCRPRQHARRGSRVRCLRASLQFVASSPVARRE